MNSRGRPLHVFRRRIGHRSPAARTRYEERPPPNSWNAEQMNRSREYVTKNYNRVEREVVDPARTRMDGATYLAWLADNVPHAVRSLRASPAFTIFSAATLAIGIGATTAIFSTVNATLLRRCPIRARAISSTSTPASSMAVSRPACYRPSNRCAERAARHRRARRGHVGAAVRRDAGARRRQPGQRRGERCHRRILRNLRRVDGARAGVHARGAHPGQAAMRRWRASHRTRAWTSLFGATRDSWARPFASSRRRSPSHSSASLRRRSTCRTAAILC